MYKKGESGTEKTVYCEGFNDLTSLIKRKTSKRGFKYSILLIGEPGLGKKTLINAIYSKDVYPQKNKLSLADRCNSDLNIIENTIKFNQDNVRIGLTVIGVQFYGDSIKNSNRIQPIINFISEKFDEHYNWESGINRQKIVDNRIHACIFFLNPIGNKLKETDIEDLKKIDDIVNIILVIAKSDILTKGEVHNLKTKILEQIKENNINVYKMIDYDEEDNDYLNELSNINKCMPFAVIGANSSKLLSDRKILGREYSWGFVNIENPQYCDFTMLKTLLTKYIHDLKDITDNTLYENYRSRKLSVNLRVERQKTIKKTFNNKNNDSTEVSDMETIAKMIIKDE